MTTRTNPAATQAGSSQRWTIRAIAVVAAVVGAALIWLVADAAGADFAVDQRNGEGPTPVGLGNVIGTAVSVAVLGVLFLAILERFSRNPLRIWTIVAVAVLVLSYLVLIIVGAAAGTKFALFLIHTWVGATLIVSLRRT